MEGNNEGYNPNQQAFDESGGIYGVIQDLLKQKEEESLIDPLIGCYNRKYWEKFSANFNPKTDRISMVSIDVDGLKQINDGPGGHAAGDKFLIDTVNFLRDIFKDPEDKIIRMGGDEFLVLSQKGKNSHESYDHFKEYVNNAFSEDKLKAKGLNFSFGIAHFTNKIDKTVQDTLERSDHRMYSNKRIRKENDSNILPYQPVKNKVCV